MLRKAVDNRLSCAEAFHIAEEYGTTYAEVGAAADESGIRIVSCRLGCF